MTIDEVKVKVVHDILEIQDEEIILGIENLLISITASDPPFKPMTISELNARIDKSEKDFENGDFVKAEDLLAKYEK